MTFRARLIGGRPSVPDADVDVGDLRRVPRDCLREFARV
jgi:hypothetical protein